ncbi:MAG: class II aldolase/adducin family protein [Aggregatilineales bacterium]
MTTINFEQFSRIQAAREHIAHIGRMLFDRNLTDAGGGNISQRIDNLVCMTPTKAAQHKQWQLDAEDILVVDFDRNILLGDGKLTREINVHLGLHKAYGDYGDAVIHAHPRNLMTFVTQARPMPAIMEATRKFGTTPVVEYAPAHTPQLGINIVESMRGREAMIKKHGAGTLAPWHGLFLMGVNMNAAFDAVERLDTNAFCLIHAQSIGGTAMLEAERTKMEDVIGNYSEE